MNRIDGLTYQIDGLKDREQFGHANSFLWARCLRRNFRDFCGLEGRSFVLS